MLPWSIWQPAKDTKKRVFRRFRQRLTLPAFSTVPVITATTMLLTLSLYIWFTFAMLFSRAAHRAFPTRLRLRLIAAVQLVAMLLLMLPAFAHESAGDHLKETAAVSAPAGQADQDLGDTGCPCCPDGEESEDDCSSCGNCTLFTSSPPAPVVGYAPSVSPLESFEPRTRLLQVHIPIFVPPQNHA